MWFLFALLSVLGWGFADLFYKKGTDENDRQSHLKMAVWVGLGFGIAALALLPFTETGFSVSSLAVNAVKYSPASFSYIISMIIGYAGLRYLELSIVSPVQNASGAFAALAMAVYFLITGNAESICGKIDVLTLLGMIVIIGGAVGIAVAENRLAVNEKQIAEDQRKYRYGALALLFPVLYCVFDTLGTAADGIILDENTGLGLGEIAVFVLYGLTFALTGLVIWIYLFIRNRRPYNPFARGELVKGAATGFEVTGQYFYIYAMAANPVVAAPMIASYCIVSVLLARVILKERLTRFQARSVAAVIAGIVILGIAEGLSEM